MSNVSTSRLGLAAYIQIQGGKLLRVQGNSFIFESDKTIKEWEIDYSNSCCHKHDSALVGLRKLRQ